MRRPQERRLAFEAIGTKWAITAQTVLADAAWRKVEREISARIEAFDKAYSRFRADSLVTRMSQAAGTYDVPADAFALLQFYERLYHATNGAVTPLIGQTVSDAGYDAQYSLRPKKLQTPPRWEDVITYNEQSITLAHPALLDFGAAGKGYLVDIVGGLLADAGVHGFWINAGGDILQRAAGSIPLQVGLENPLQAGEVIGVAEIWNQSICASSGARRAWGAYHHIIDPRTLKSPVAIAGTWVVAASTMLADGLATALFFTEPGELAKHFMFDYAVLESDMGLARSSGFPAMVYEAA